MGNIKITKTTLINFFNHTIMTTSKKSYQVIFQPNNSGIEYFQNFDNEQDANEYADMLHSQMLFDMAQAGTSYQPGIFSVIENN